MSIIASDKEDTRLNVSGRGSSRTGPDYFSVRFTISMEDPNDTYCYDSVVEKTEKFLKSLKTWAKKTDMIRTSSFTLTHHTLSEKQGGWPKGKVLADVSAMIYVESGRIDEIPKLLSIARKNNVTGISDIKFRLSDALLQSEREKALAIAADGAKKDAEVIAKAFGISVTGISSIDIRNVHNDYDDDFDYDRIPYLSETSFEEDNEPVPEFVSSGELTTSVSVDVVFSLSGFNSAESGKK